MNKKLQNKIHFRQGDKKILCTVSSISTGKRIYYLVDSSFVDENMYLYPDKIDDLGDIIDDTLPGSNVWDAGYNYRLELVD
jgi:hypothetical protein